MYKVPEVDRLIITKIMRWTDVGKSGKVSEHSWFDSKSNYMTRKTNFRPSSSIKDAMVILQRLQSQGYDVQINLLADGDYECKIWNPKGICYPSKDLYLLGAINETLVFLIEQEEL
ncbi:hypothetical protein MXL46_11695 [Heyndrickxia sporothermodurans]|uniref:BC1872 family protein n=1 Tax=Heyndrickxia sporothermodurans TaxID=46224 RepID=UPI002DB8FF21|nr:hypothetical protein [Heyndrickxia sporothermodurans]MEB6549749.1 hypothetical protein [Heyndrickxia sporothermodurans]